jgi:nucleotide-binding universal stress UspA family protein
MTRATEADGRSWRPGPAEFELGTDGPGTIVVGIDGSPTSMRALAYAAGQARRQHGRLVAVYVQGFSDPWAGLDPGTYVDPAAAVTATLAAGEATQTELRTEVQRVGRSCGVEIRFVVRRGETLRELAEVADQEHADAVIVGSSTRLGHRLAGSLAVRLVRRSGWPVTVVP